MESIGARLKRWRLEKGWAKRTAVVRALAALGIKKSAESIRQYEEGVILPSREMRKHLAKVFGKEEPDLEFADLGQKTAERRRPYEAPLILAIQALTDDQQKELLPDLQAVGRQNTRTNQQLRGKLQLILGKREAARTRKKPRQKGKA